MKKNKRTTNPQKTREKNYELITDKVIQLLERGVKPWCKPWHATPFSNFISKNYYSGGNPLLCQLDLMLFEYEHPYFLSFKQAKDLGWAIKKGSKATTLTYVGTYSRKIEQEDESEIDKFQTGVYTKFYKVFNLSCVDDSKGKKKIADLMPAAAPPRNPDPTLPSVEEFCNLQNVSIVHGGDRACYSSKLDRISMPYFETFSSAIRYYMVKIHEEVHATGHKSRLDRKLGNRFGSNSYAFEELVAETGTAFVCNFLGITEDLELEHHASYLDSWLTVLNNDKQAFFRAVSLARQASDYMLRTAGLIEEEENATD